MFERPSRLLACLQRLMGDYAGPIRDQAGLQSALGEILSLRDALGTLPPPSLGDFDTVRLDWFDVRNMLLIGETVVRAALARRESRGAHQRGDFPLTDRHWAVNQTVRMQSEALSLERAPFAHDAANMAKG